MRTIMFLPKYITILFLLSLLGCKAIPPEIKLPLSEDQPREITIFIDGTNNTKKDNTNIRQLYDISPENEKRASFYTVGVGGGPDLQFLGLMFGTGIGNDVREAYLYICQTYNTSRADKLHVFGFSRGAYTAQVLANLIYVAGVLDLNNISDENAEIIIKQMYRAYRGRGDYGLRRKNINKVIRKWEKKLLKQLIIHEDVIIESLNLFDTVEALSAPDYTENQCYPNANHMRQFFNVKRVYHAMSLDDNRAQIFTPILSTCSEIAVNGDIDDIVEEVWFAGAHSDIGGGYDPSKNNRLANVSLRWLIGELKSHNLFEIPTFNDNDDYEVIHDAEGSGINKFIYRRLQRDIPRYLKENKGKYNFGKLKIHASVINRLALGKYCDAPKLPRKKDTIWYDRTPFDKCFKKIDDKRIFLEEQCNVITKVNSKI